MRVRWLMSAGGPRLQYLMLAYITRLTAALDGGTTYGICPRPALPLYDTKGELVGARGGRFAVGVSTQVAMWWLTMWGAWMSHQEAVEHEEEDEQAARRQGRGKRRGQGQDGEEEEEQPRPLPRAMRIFRFKDAPPEMQRWAGPEGPDSAAGRMLPRAPPLARIARDLPALYDNMTVLHVPRVVHASVVLRLVRAAMFPKEALSRPTQAPGQPPGHAQQPTASDPATTDADSATTSAEAAGASTSTGCRSSSGGGAGPSTSGGTATVGPAGLAAAAAPQRIDLRGRVALAEEDRCATSSGGLASCREALRYDWSWAGPGPLPGRAAARLAEWWRLCVELLHRYLTVPLFKPASAVENAHLMYAPEFTGRVQDRDLHAVCNAGGA